MNPIQQAKLLQGEQIDSPEEKQERYLELIKQDPRCIRYVSHRLLNKNMVLQVCSTIPKTSPPPGGIIFYPWQLDFFFDIPSPLYNDCKQQILTMLTLKGYSDVYKAHPIYWKD